MTDTKLQSTRRRASEEIAALMVAKIQCIWINSYEEEVVIKDIQKLSKQIYPNHEIKLWSFGEGLRELPANNFIKPPPPDPKMTNPKNLFKEITQDVSDQKDIIYILRDYHNVTRNPEAVRLIRDLKEYKANNVYVPIIVIAPNDEIPSELQKLFTLVDYDLPNKAFLRFAIERADESTSSNDSDFIKSNKEKYDLLANACVGLTINEVLNALRISKAKLNTFDVNFINQQKIDLIRKSGVLNYVVPNVTLDDLGGNEVFKNWIKEVKLTFSDKAASYGIKRSHGYISFGVPGCGKTTIATAIADYFNMPLIMFDSSKVMSSTVGSSERNMDQALKTVQACAPCVFLIDEAEKLFGGTQSSNQTDGGTLNRVMAKLLTLLTEDNGIFTIMTSNDVSQLPPELTRSGRLDTQWFFDLPPEKERATILKVHMDKTNKTYDESLIKEYAHKTENYTGAEIEELVKIALRKSFKRNLETDESNINHDDLEAAMSEVVTVYQSSIEKINGLKNYAKGRARVTFEVDKTEDSILDTDIILDNDIFAEGL